MPPPSPSQGKHTLSPPRTPSTHCLLTGQLQFSNENFRAPNKSKG
jgi:hypothetical protein